MKTITVTQGSPNWSALRAKHNTASEAPVMMGASKYQTRDDLLRQKATGIVPEVGRHQQALFDRGHVAEAAARVILEESTGEDFYPITALSDCGRLLASVDGITISDRTLFEHKLWNEKLAAQVRAGELDPHYYWQLEQQLLVTGAEFVIFMCSDGTVENIASMNYYPVPGRAAALVAGWAQFDIDKAAYVPVEATAALAPTGRAPETLPALFITVKGEVTDSNLANFKEVALAAIRSVNRELSTDQDFADAIKAVKWCSDIEERVANAKQNALSQTASIDALFKTLDDINAEAREVRISLDKLVKARTLTLKTELLVGVQTQIADHVRSLNKRIGRDYMPYAPVDFAAAIHGKKNFDSMRAALNAALANAKIEASATADRISVNMATLDALAIRHMFLFLDASTIVLKANDDLTALVKMRIADHQTTELAKEEATRQRIRAEEQAKAEAAAREQAAEARRLAEIAAFEKLEADEIERLDRANRTMMASRPAPPTAQDIADGVVDAEVKPAANVVPALVSVQPVILPLFTVPAPAATPAVEAHAWQTSQALPEVPMQWVEVQEVNLYRFLPYKPNSTEFKRGKKGRWQRHNGYGFENAEPQAGPWRLADGSDDTERQAA